MSSSEFAKVIGATEAAEFTPTRASWLNQIEIWFSILSRQALQGANLTSVAQLHYAIDEFIKNDNSDTAPF